MQMNSRVQYAGGWAHSVNTVSLWGQPRNDYIQSIMMNYFTFSPNFPIQLQQTAQNYPLRSVNPTQAILTTLSCALTNSILNYQNASFARTNPPEPSSLTHTASSSKKEPFLPLVPTWPSQTEIQLTVQKQNKGIPDEKTDVPQIASQIDVKNTPSSTKATQKNEDKSALLATAREQNTKKKSEDSARVDASKNDSLKIGTAVPKVDLIQTAYIGACHLYDRVWSEKRVQLQTRRVDQWTDKGKNRRDKRQLRLLQN